MVVLLTQDSCATGQVPSGWGKLLRFGETGAYALVSAITSILSMNIAFCFPGATLAKWLSTATFHGHVLTMVVGIKVESPLITVAFLLLMAFKMQYY